MLVDNGGRRIEKERRKFSYTIHIPERRVAKDTGAAVRIAARSRGYSAELICWCCF